MQATPFAQKSKPFVSVIIPVYNNAEGLRACLRALEAQTYPSDSFEVVVADNGSRDDEDPARVVAEFARARLVKEAKVGSYAARNAAAAVAVGDVFAFTDSDCLPDASWMERGVARLTAEPGVGLVAGSIEVFPHDRAHPTVAETIDLYEGFPQERFVRDYHFGATANVFTTRAVWEKNGPFDSSLKSGGDLNWGNRVYSLNLPLVFEPACVVRHPARRTFAELKAKTARVVGGGTTLQMRAGRTLYHFARLMKPPIGRSLRIVRNTEVDFQRKLGCVAMFFVLKAVEVVVALRVALGAETARS
jgi:glycosyltransferase involved in cell wall biosynthesis